MIACGLGTASQDHSGYDGLVQHQLITAGGHTGAPLITIPGARLLCGVETASLINAALGPLQPQDAPGSPGWGKGVYVDTEASTRVPTVMTHEVGAGGNHLRARVVGPQPGGFKQLEFTVSALEAEAPGQGVTGSAPSGALREDPSQASPPAPAGGWQPLACGHVASSLPPCSVASPCACVCQILPR